MANWTTETRNTNVATCVTDVLMMKPLPAVPMKLFESDTVWWWDVYFGKRWLQCHQNFSRAQDARRSGNAWARRMNLQPRWE